MANIEGRNPVIEALKGPRKIQQIFIKKGAGGRNIEKIKQLAAAKNISVKFCSEQEISSMAKTFSPQGVVARGEEIALWDEDEFIKYVKKDSKPALILVLDHLKDPHNMGAIIRTAYAAGAHGLIFPADRAAGLTPAVLKTSSGAAEHLPLVCTVNINNIIKKIKQSGIWVVGAELKEAETYYQQDLNKPLALVVGREGRGLKRLVKENCDFLIKIPLKNNMDSLNVSVAAGILVYDIVRQRDK